MKIIYKAFFIIGGFVYIAFSKETETKIYSGYKAKEAKNITKRLVTGSQQLTLFKEKLHERGIPNNVSI